MRYLALLRGVNVGGKNSVSMAQIRRVFEDVGHTEVSTYINSGNVVFDASRSPAARLADELEAAIERELGLATRVLVLPRSSVVRIAAAIPHVWLEGDQSSCNVLYLLPERASPKTLEALDLNPEHEDARYVSGAIISRVDRAHVGRSALHRLIGTDLYAAMTVRRGSTAKKLAELVTES